MERGRTDVLLLLLMGIILLLMVAIFGLFLRMNQLQREVLVALESMRQAQQPFGLPLGIKAPSFTLPDLSGQSVSIEAFSGRKVLLVFASPRCPACRDMYPHLKAFAGKHPEVAVVMVSMGTEDENRQMVQGEGFEFPVLRGDEGVVAAYRVPGTPFFYLIGEDGIIARAGFASTLEQLEALAGVK
jgi:methylamine dehydrogenase accessory protein MauD